MDQVKRSINRRLYRTKLVTGLFSQFGLHDLIKVVGWAPVPSNIKKQHQAAVATGRPKLDMSSMAVSV